MKNWASVLIASNGFIEFRGETQFHPVHFGDAPLVVSIIKIQDALVPMLDFEAIGAKVGNSNIA